MSSLDVCGYQQKKYTLYNIYNMKKFFIFAASAALLASCANDEIIDNGGKQDQQVPITLSTYKKNVTRADNTTSLESNLHYNFGTWAQKYKSGSTQKVMENYLVGFGGTNVGYDPTNATTYATSAGDVTDHKSPWFYEGLGTEEYNYTADAGFYKKTQNAYMSAHANQYLRYWDLAYTNTYFYCYVPYMASGVDCSMSTDGSASMTFSATAIRDGYDNPINSTYKPTTGALDRSLSEFMVGGVKAINADLKDITIPFKHLGSQLFIRFYESVPGYKVELIDLSADNGTMKSGVTDDQKLGVQATPAVVGTPNYTVGSYNTTSGASVSFAASDATPTVTSNYTGATTSTDNLMFKVPSISASEYSTANVPTGYGSVSGTNYTTVSSAQDGSDHYVIPEVVTFGTQAYAWSPTIYYPVAQPTAQTTGFTFHVSFRIISDDNKEVTTVHNATVYVPAMSSETTPASIARWESGKRYIYTFNITRNATGTTNPATEIDPTNPTPSVKKSLYPIVFDGCTVVDYTEANSEHLISGDTTTY